MWQPVREWKGSLASRVFHCGGVADVAVSSNNEVEVLPFGAATWKTSLELVELSVGIPLAAGNRLRFCPDEVLECISA